MKCSCKHKLKEHKFNNELQSYDECMVCDCEGFDNDNSSISELELGG